MDGLFIGDMAGSFREFSKHKFVEESLIPDSMIEIGLTDDSILAMATGIACGKAFARGQEPDPVDFRKEYYITGKMYPTTIGGYGGSFRRWLRTDGSQSYGSYGNGSAMRVGPVIYFADSLEMCERLARNSALATHDHPEGIKGAVYTALMAYLYRNGEKDPVSIIADRFGLTYDRSEGYDHFDAICQETMPLALNIFEKNKGFEKAVYAAVTQPHGDSDTLGAIVGTMAQFRDGVPEDLASKMYGFVQPELIPLLNEYLNYIEEKE